MPLAPVPVLDLLAIPGNYEAGAMENWGAITFIDNVMLFDPATSSPQYATTSSPSPPDPPRSEPPV